MNVYTPSTDPFWVGDPCADIKDYVPSVHKPTIGECKSGSSILGCLEEIKDCLKETSEDYERSVTHLCETLSDGTEVFFTRIIESIYDKKTNTSTTTKKDLLTDMVTEYVVVDETNVSGRKVKTVEQCDAFLNSGMQSDWANF